EGNVRNQPRRTGSVPKDLAELNRHIDEGSGCELWIPRQRHADLVEPTEGRKAERPRIHDPPIGESSSKNETEKPPQEFWRVVTDHHVGHPDGDSFDDEEQI